MSRKLSLEDLRLCRDGPERVRDLFRTLGYAVEGKLVPLSIDTLDGEPILTLKREKALIPGDVERALDELHRLKERFFAAEPGERAALRAHIQEQLGRVVEAHVSGSASKS